LVHFERVATPRVECSGFAVVSSSLVPDDLLEAIRQFLPIKLPKPTGGRPRVPGHDALGGTVFVLRPGCQRLLLQSRAAGPADPVGGCALLERPVAGSGCTPE